MSEVKFLTLLHNWIVPVSVQSDDTLVDLFKSIRNDPHEAPCIPAKVTYHTCNFYRLKSPVRAIQDDEGDGFELSSVREACLQENNIVHIPNPITRVRRLAETFSADHVYLIIKFPEIFIESDRAVAALRENHGSLFKCLQVMAPNPNKWSFFVVEENLQGGVFTKQDDHPFFKEILDALAKPRLYQIVDGQERDLENARSFKTQFDRIFALTGTESCTVTSGREFMAFYNVLRLFNPDVKKIIDSSSLTFKASNLAVHFIHPPFFSENSRNLTYHQEQAWNFPIFLASDSTQDIWRTFTPTNDWMVASRDFGLPLVVAQMTPQKLESDHFRMLVQATVLARAGQHLLKSTSKKRFFVVAIHVNARMFVTRYLVLQTNSGSTEDKPVSIHEKGFNLANSEQQIKFLREMYNLATEITALSDDLDESKRTSLSDIKAAAKRVSSLSPAPSETETTSSSDSDSSMEGERGGEFEDEDGLGVFEAEDIQTILRQMDYKIEFIPWGHPELAVIVSKAGDAHGYLKFVKREREIEVLRYLSGIESPSNYTISGVRFWPVEGGTVVSMPVAGGWLTVLDRPSEHVWSVAQQLFEAVAFMHEHNVAHMDLKPQNVIIPPEGGRLSIIDFSVSIHVRGPDVKYSGVVGTEDYMAPEVREGNYKPMLADLWSCGRTLEELCLRCEPSAECAKLLEVARQLRNVDPEARPRMNTLLEWIANLRRGEDMGPVHQNVG